MDQERLEKLKKLPSLGINPYPANYLNRSSSKDLKSSDKVRELADIESQSENSVRIAGRMMLFRSMGKLSFGQVQDQEGRFQFCFKDGYTQVKDLKTEEISARKFWEKMLDLGDYIGLEGEIFITKHGEKTMLVKEITFLGKALRPMPEKFSGLSDDEIKLRQRYLDTITSEESRNRFKMRSDIIRAIREFFWSENFMEVETPILEHKATGAAARPYYTHNNGLDIDVVLRISQELPHKKIIIGGYEKIFEIGKAFRNEGIDPSHLPEHTHFEWYVAYWSYIESMDFLERMIKHVIKSLDINPVIPIKDKDGNIQNVDFSKKFERIDYVKLIEKDCGINVLEVTDPDTLRKQIKDKNIHFDNMDEMGYATLVDYLYKKVSRPKITGPAFLYNYPKKIQPLARVNDEDENIVDQFQLLANGWELSKGYSELVDPQDQSRRFEEQQVEADAGDEEAMQGDDEYIRAMEYGMPPISGTGLGLDRLITLLCQQENLRDCVLFPLMRPKG